MRSADADTINFKVGSVGSPSNSGTGTDNIFLGTQGPSSTADMRAWNYFYPGVVDNSGQSAGASFTDLYTSGSVATTVDFTISGPGNIAYSGLGWGSPAPSNLINSSFVRAGAGVTRTFSFAGLNPSFTYDLYLFGLGDFNAPGTEFTVTDNVGTTSQSTTGWSGMVTSGTGAVPWQLGKSYVVFTGLTPTVSGSMNGTWADSVAKPGESAGFNGFQLVAVPEPSSLAGLGVIGIGLAAVIRRRLRAAKSAS
jgi:hypothetical protein